jgi:hypothetical protein
MVSGSQVLTRTMQKQSSNKHTVVRAWGHLFGDVRYKLKWKMTWEWKPHELGFKAKFAALGCPTVFMEAFRSSLDLVTLDLVADPVFEALFGEHCALVLTSLEFPMLWRCNRQHTALPFPPSGVWGVSLQLFLRVNFGDLARVGGTCKKRGAKTWRLCSSTC